MTANAELDGAGASADLLSLAAIAVGTVPTPEQRRREDDLLAAALARRALLRSEGYFGPPPTKPAHGESGPESPPPISVRVAPSVFSFDNDLSESSSLKSSVVDHVYENGMRYHGFRAGKYPFPNDDVEQNRDDMKHTMAQMLCHDAYFYSPIEDALEAGGEVLDLGTLVSLPSIRPAPPRLGCKDRPGRSAKTDLAGQSAGKRLLQPTTCPHSAGGCCFTTNREADLALHIAGTGTGIWAIERKWLAAFRCPGSCTTQPGRGQLHPSGSTTTNPQP